MRPAKKSKPVEPTPFDKLRSLAKKIVNVPKSEIDRETKKYEKAKEKRKSVS